MKREGWILKSSISIYLILVVILIFPEHTAAQPDARDEFRSLLVEIKKSVSEDKKALALDLIGKAIDKLSSLDDRPVLDEEALRWDIAQLNLDRAETMVNDEQRINFANESIKRWLEYTDWYNNLDDRKREIMQNNPNSDRIQKAVKQLGNAIIRRGNTSSYSIRELFTTYIDLPVIYLSSQSVQLWKEWLLRCPTWKQADGISIRNLKSKFDDNQNICRDDWEDFASFLKEWLQKQSLNDTRKSRFTRLLEDLNYALGNDDP